jgi:AraC-like DNA-binding protein
MLSIRLLWPFARLLGSHRGALDFVSALGITIADFPNPDTRISHRVATQLLERTVERTRDPTIGLRAGELVDPGDFEVLEHAARCAANLGDAIRCMSRYFRLVHEAAELSVVEAGDFAELRFHVLDDVRDPPAANDFCIAAALAFSRRNCTTYEPPVVVRLAHARPAYAAQYDRHFGTQVVFDAPFNAMVIHRSRLAVPMRRASPDLLAAFELQGRHLLEKLEDRQSVTGQGRNDVSAQLRVASVSMLATARRLAMSIATLRRRLEDEGTTFSAIVAEVRRKLAERYLREPRPAIGEIAFLLGFSNVTAFGRAFKRWVGVSPTEYRSTMRQS